MSEIEIVKTDRNCYEVRQKLKFQHGFKNNIPNWKTIIQCPITEDASIQVNLTGEFSQEAMKKLIKLLEFYTDDKFWNK
jgi:phosphotransferase system HPr-like phosphotransfer protein